MFKKKNTWFVVLLVLHTILACFYIAKRDITFDEPQYFEYAKRWMHGQPERVEILDDSKTPITVIAWIPRIFEQLGNKEMQYNDGGKSDQKAGRYVMVLFTLLTAFYIFLWGRKLLGVKWSLLPVILFLFDPLVLAHSGVIGSDIASAGIYLAVLFHLWRWLLEKRRKDFLLLSVLLGIGCITKQNLVLLVFIVPVACLLHHLKTRSFVSFFSRKNVFSAVAAVVIIWLVINAAFYFHGSFNTLSSYHFQSTTFQNLQKILGFLSNCPVLLPQPFVRGFDMIQYHAQIGGGKVISTYDSVMVWGYESETHGFWFYYLATAFFKFPVTILLLSVAAFVAFIRIVIKRKFIVRTEWLVLLLPSLVFFFIMSCFNNFQIGIRHIIFLLPPLFILIGVYIKHFMAIANKRLKIALYVLPVWQCLSVAIFFNNYMAYTNEFAFNKIEIMKWVNDSSMDYGQNNSLVKKYIDEHPGFRMPDSFPSKGKFAVRAMKVLHTVKRDNDRYAWLRKNYKPFGSYKGTIWLYDISELKEEK